MGDLTRSRLGEPGGLSRVGQTGPGSVRASGTTFSALGSVSGPFGINRSLRSGRTALVGLVPTREAAWDGRWWSRVLAVMIC